MGLLFMFLTQKRIMIHYKTNKCPKILGRITDDHCNTVPVICFKQNCCRWLSPVFLFNLICITSGDSFLYKTLCSRLLCLQCMRTWRWFVGMTVELRIVVRDMFICRLLRAERYIFSILFNDHCPLNYYSTFAATPQLQAWRLCQV